MRINLVLMITIVLSVDASQKFCVKDRKVLLSGVFNYENIVFAYSWINVGRMDSQQQIVWRFQMNNKQFVELGKSLTVEQVFPGIPLFRAGFGLTLNCDANDEKCNLYDKLVFVFFQTTYQVFRFLGDRFAVEPNNDNIPWGLTTRGDAKEFGFENDFDNVFSAAFIPGLQPQLFIVSKDILYKSLVDIKAPSLKWSKLAESVSCGNYIGAFVFGSELFFNQPDGMLIIFDSNGKQIKNKTAWTYFGCNGELAINHVEEEELDTRYGLVIISIIIIAVIISNTFAALFWLFVRKSKTTTKPPNV